VGEGEDEGAKIKNVHFNITLTSILSHQGRGGKWIPLDTAQLAGRRFIHKTLCEQKNRWYNIKVQTWKVVQVIDKFWKWIRCVNRNIMNEMLRLC
jgi:hypothetical protein